MTRDEAWAITRRRLEGVLDDMHRQTFETVLDAIGWDEMQEAVDTAQRLCLVIGAEINPLDKHPAKCPDDPNESCLTCIADATDDVRDALANLHRNEMP